jgi:Family of unknown function (DUF5678)
MLTERMRNNVKIDKPQIFDNIPNLCDSQLLQTVNSINSALIVLGFVTESRIPVITNYDIEEDFEWYCSGQLNTNSFKGKYIAIWRKQIVGSGETATETERLAKAYFGENCRPAIVYVPEDDSAIL